MSNLAKLNLEIAAILQTTQPSPSYRRPETHTGMNPGNPGDGKRTVTLRPKDATPKTEAELQALSAQRAEKKDARERDKEQNKVQAALVAQDRWDLARTPDVIRRRLKELDAEYVNVVFQINKLGMDAVEEEQRGLKEELKDKLALLETFLNLQGNTVDALQKQMAKLGTMRTWFGNFTSDGRKQKYNEEKTMKIDAKMKDLQHQINFMNELANKQAAERARLRENADRKERRQVAIDRNDPAGLEIAERNGATGWWIREGSRQARKKKQRDCREAALQREGLRANPDPVGPNEVKLPSPNLDELEWEEEVNAQLLKSGTVAIDIARRDKEAEEALLARCEATKKAKKRAQNADATDNPIGKRSA